MPAVQRRRRAMVQERRKAHEENTKASGADLIMGVARFVAPRTVDIELRDVERGRFREIVCSSTSARAP